MTDYSTLKAGAKLDRMVAETAGYRVEMKATGKLNYRLMYEDEPQTGWLISEDAAWRFAPRYSTDANAVLTLENKYVRIVLAPFGHWQVAFERDDVINGTGFTMPLAYCRAWLAWKAGINDA